MKTKVLERCVACNAGTSLFLPRKPTELQVGGRELRARITPSRYASLYAVGNRDLPEGLILPLAAIGARQKKKKRNPQGSCFTVSFLPSPLIPSTRWSIGCHGPMRFDISRSFHFGRKACKSRGQDEPECRSCRQRVRARNAVIRTPV